MYIGTKSGQQVSLANLAALTALVLIFILGTGIAIATMAAGVRVSPLPGIAALLSMQAIYLALASWLARRMLAPASLVRRYAMRLQLQALAEIVLNLGLIVAVLVLPFCLLEGAQGQEELRAIVLAPAFRKIATGIALALPSLLMLIAVWRLHHLSLTPGALAAAADNSLPHRIVQLRADAGAVREALVRHIERLTDSATPGLGRMFAGRPRVLMKQGGQHAVYELVWSNVPTKLQLSLRAREDGEQEVAVACRLRGGIYKGYLFATPADALAQMQYIEAHLLQPLRAQLAMLSAERQRDALRDQAVEAQLRILQAQIEPHFLFNSLANVRHLYREDIGAGEHMLDHLIAYLRCAMEDLRAAHSTVRKEMDLVRHYLTIMQIRMGERLAYTFTAPDSLLEHAFPPAMLISLVENAIKHGLADADRGSIALSVHADQTRLSLTVADNGRGFSSVGGTGVGLSNIRRRLEAMYGDHAWLEVGAPPAGGFSATIVIPFDSPV